jgi:uncharacterized membrane protein
MASGEIIDSDGDPKNDRIIVAIVYVLYLVGPANGISMLIGAIIAYLRKDSAPAWLASHYEFQIRTVLYALALFVIALIGFFTIILIPLSLLIWFLLSFWVVIRVAIGLMRLVDGRAHPNPASFLF